MRRVVHHCFWVVACALVVTCSKGGNGSAGPTAPGSGGSAPAAGTWTGTLTRPGGLGTMSLRWVATASGAQLTGPMTLTHGATSVTIPAVGNTGGNDSSGYGIHMSFNSNAGDIAAFPLCSIRGNSANASGDPFPSPYTSISTPTFSISYSGCRGFVDTGYSSPLSNFLQETVQLSLRK